MSRFVVYLAGEVLIAGVLFGAAGRLDLPWFWAWLGLHAVLVGLALALIDRGLLAERIRPGAGGTDRSFRKLLGIFVLAFVFVAGLDAGRFGWSARIPVAARALALLVYAGGLGLAGWGVAVNRFYSPVVRIQEERGHRLIDIGPYRYVRHPGYSGTMLSLAGGAIALGSWWSLLPVTVCAGLIVRRTWIEERFLRQELAGYGLYTERVRYRFIPGLV
jgi:protein-S-isoprenylcysteine O-methyltransferase Ste14